MFISLSPANEVSKVGGTHPTGMLLAIINFGKKYIYSSAILRIFYTCCRYGRKAVISCNTGKILANGNRTKSQCSDGNFPINATNCYFLCFVPFQRLPEVRKCSRCLHVLKGTDFRNQIDEVFLDLVWWCSFRIGELIKPSETWAGNRV